MKLQDFTYTLFCSLTPEQVDRIAQLFNYSVEFNAKWGQYTTMLFKKGCNMLRASLSQIVRPTHRACTAGTLGCQLLMSRFSMPEYDKENLIDFTRKLGHQEKVFPFVKASILAVLIMAGIVIWRMMTWGS